MDDSVLAAIARWPDVPAAYGWLSLTARGEWRLHPLGDAADGGPGVGISNTQILGFIGRNYVREVDGSYYFQNGPQRVYVRLDAAPFVIHTVPALGSFCSHNSLVVNQFNEWVLDETGQLYAHTDIGPVRIDDRDLLAVAEQLNTSAGVPLLTALDNYGVFEDPVNSVLPDLLVGPVSDSYPALYGQARLRKTNRLALEQELGFIANPKIPLK